jgi:hypothetical protein
MLAVLLHLLLREHVLTQAQPNLASAPDLDRPFRNSYKVCVIKV